MALDCSPGWEQRYLGSAYAGAVCKHLDITGEAGDPAATARAEFNFRNASAVGLNVTEYAREAAKQTGIDIRTGLPTGSGGNPATPAAGGIPVAWWLIGGAGAVAAGLYLWRR